MSTSSKLSFIASVTAIAAVTAAIGTGTYAALDDTEAQGDKTQAGTLDISVNGADGAIMEYDIAELVPGDSHTRTFDVVNSGNLDGNLTVDIRDIKTGVDSCNETERAAETSAGVLSCGAGDGGTATELDDQIRVTLERATGVANNPDTVADESWSFVYNAISLAADPSAATFPIGDADADASDTHTFRLTYVLPDSTTNNQVQGDSVEFDLDFDVTQLTGGARTDTPAARP